MPKQHMYMTAWLSYHNACMRSMHDKQKYTAGLMIHSKAVMQCTTHAQPATCTGAGMATCIWHTTCCNTKKYKTDSTTSVDQPHPTMHTLHTSHSHIDANPSSQTVLLVSKATVDTNPSKHPPPPPLHSPQPVQPVACLPIAVWNMSVRLCAPANVQPHFQQLAHAGTAHRCVKAPPQRLLFVSSKPPIT
jgi:hypothetical protein